ncbi:MAG: SDR family oxidoreductase [Bacteroidetes bacterium]|nr:SDR family oxidoreductase [Bacteroidota bacterium]
MSKHAVVTGGTKGIGKEICHQLAQKGYSVLMIGRDKAAGEALQTEISREFPGSKITYQFGDLGSIKTTRELVRQIQNHFSTIDLLVNNAGIWPTELSLNEDGLERAFMVNHLAPFILTHGLISQLQQNSPSRVVMVNAGLYINGKADPEETPYGKDFHKIKTYANTKLCNVLMTLELAERLQKHKITVNALHPGVVKTELGDFGGILGAILKFVKLFWLSPSKGAEAPVWVSTAPELEGITGKYYDKTKEMDLAENAKDENLQKALWKKSLELTGIQWED